MPARIDMIGIFVQDIQRMVTFYGAVLGFEIGWNRKGPYAEFTNAGVRFSMYECSQLPALLGQTPNHPAGINGPFGLAIDLPASVGVDREFARLVACGGTAIYAPREEPWGMRSSMIADPEGNLIELASSHRGV